MPGSGPPEPDNQARCLAVWEAVRDGTLDKLNPAVTLSVANARCLQSCAAPVHGLVLVGGVAHVLLEFGDGSGLLAVPR